jgi:hypothetical protein
MNQLFSGVRWEWGKTHLAQSLRHQVCRIGYNVFFTKTSRLLADLGGGHADETWEKRIRLPFTRYGSHFRRKSDGQKSETYATFKATLCIDHFVWEKLFFLHG